MDKVILVYIIIQLITTAYGLAVLESVKPIVANKLRDKGYVQKNNNSLYKFNTTASDILNGFIPFYYFAKALSVVSNKKNINKLVDEEIKSGRYINKDELVETDNIVIEETKSDILVNPETEIVFEKPEKYKAKKNDISLYDTYETPVEYITRETEKEDDLELSPFLNEDNKVETVIVKDEVTKEDIAKAISELSVSELEMLQNKLIELSNLKKKDLMLKLEKDVA